MLNKKLLAASIAATLSTSAFAAINLDSKDGYDVVKYAQEEITGTEFDANDAGTVLDVTSKVGFAVSSGQKRYVRVDLTNATFQAEPGLVLSVANAGTPDTDLLAGGGADSTFAIFEISSSDSIAQSDTVTLDMSALEVSSSSDASITFRLYEELTPASNEGDALYTNADNTIITTATAYAKSVVMAGSSPEATVASNFENFGGDPAVTAASLGSLNFAGALATDVLDPSDSTPISAADIFDANYTATLNGDVSFGDFYLSTASDCSANSVELNEAEDDMSAATAADAIPRSAGVHYVCVSVANDDTDEVVVNKGEYSLELVGSGDDVITGDLAEIAYDTVSVEVPYITTFSDYRQRIYLVNRSNKDVFYTTTFRTEGVAVATPGSAAEGTIPAGEMIAVKAEDMVSLRGRTRTAATIELEALAGTVDVTTQTVNLSNGTTDTVKLTD